MLGDSHFPGKYFQCRSRSPFKSPIGFPLGSHWIPIFLDRSIFLGSPAPTQLSGNSAAGRRCGRTFHGQRKETLKQKKRSCDMILKWCITHIYTYLYISSISSISFYIYINLKIGFICKSGTPKWPLNSPGNDDLPSKLGGYPNFQTNPHRFLR